MVALGLKTGFIGSPFQSEFLAFGGDPVGRSLVGVAVNIPRLVGAELLLCLRLFPGSVVRSSVAVSPNKMLVLKLSLHNRSYTSCYLH